MRHFTILLSVLLCLNSFNLWAGGKVKVPLTAERINACKKFFEDLGDPLPAGADISSIVITAEDWTCTSCGHNVNGISANFPQEAAECDNCGKPMMPGRGELYQKNSVGSLTMNNEQIAASLEVGANWTCEYCQAGGNRHKINGTINRSCRSCGATRVDFSNHAKKNTVEDPFAKESVKKQAIANNKKSIAKAAEREKILNQPFEKTQPQNLNEFRQVLIKNHKGLKIGGGLVAAFGLFSYATLHDKPITGTVTKSHWIQTVRIEQYQPVIERLPRNELEKLARSYLGLKPNDFLKPEAFKNIEPVMPNNGLGEKPGIKVIDCSSQTNVCLYETYKWNEIDSKVTEGSIETPIPANHSWTGFEVPAYGRILINTRFDVDIEFQVQGESFVQDWRPNTFDEFKNFKPGSKLTLTIDPLKNVHSIKVEK